MLGEKVPHSIKTDCVIVAKTTIYKNTDNIDKYYFLLDGKLFKINKQK